MGALPSVGDLNWGTTLNTYLQDPLLIGVAANFIPGSIGPVAATSALGANYGYFNRLMSGGYAFSNLVINVAVSSGNMSLAVYTNSGTGMSSAPTGGRLATTGAIATPAAGVTTVATVSLGSTVTPNLGDWVGLSVDNTTASFMRENINATAGFLLIPGGGMYQASAHPLPSTPAATAAATATGYIMRGS